MNNVLRKTIVAASVAAALGSAGAASAEDFGAALLPEIYIDNIEIDELIANAAINTNDVNAYVLIEGPVGTNLMDVLGTGVADTIATTSTTPYNGGIVVDPENPQALVGPNHTINETATAISNVTTNVEVDSEDFAQLRNTIATRAIGAFNDGNVSIADQNSTEFAADVNFHNSNPEFDHLQASFSQYTNSDGILNVAYNSGMINGQVEILTPLGMEGTGVALVSVIGTDINTTAIGAVNVGDVSIGVNQ